MNMSELKLTNSEMVQQFMTAFGQEIPKKAGFPDEKTIELRVKLIREEVKEWEEALVNKDFPNAMQELVDILVVSYGAALAFGVNLDPLFKEVHRANMSKLGPNGEVLRREDGKILKSSSFVPANIERVMMENGYL